MIQKSESISNLAVALVKFNSEVAAISKDADNPFFKNKYATLDNIIDGIRPVLTKHGLSVLQIPGGDGEKVIMKTLLLHESGEWIESDPFIMTPIKNDPQAVGSCVTYARRYSLAAFLSLNTGEDDDGNKATHKTDPNRIKPQTLGTIKTEWTKQGYKPAALAAQIHKLHQKDITELTEAEAQNFLKKLTEGSEQSA